MASTSASGSDNKLSIDFTGNGISEFPYVSASGSIVPKSYILVHIKKDELADGERKIESSNTVSYLNTSGRAKSSTNSIALVGYAQ